MTSGRMVIVLLVAATVMAAAAGSAAPADEVYVYDEAIANEIDVEQFLRNGEVVLRSGEPVVTCGEPFPVPPDYPPLRILQPGFEQLGMSTDQADGIRFIGSGPVWKKNHLVVVMWKIRLPEASARVPGDFDDPLTVSLWVDWNRNDAWGNDELVVQRNVDVSGKITKRRESVTVFFVTAFRVPDVPPTSRGTLDHGHGGEVVDLWVRGTVAYGDAQVGPAGDQLFGDVEDYRVQYEVRRNKRDD